MNKQSMFTLLLAILCLPVFANNITVSPPTLTNGSISDGYGYVTFDLSWENSWRMSSGISNWDAAWVFVKYRVGSGEWLPANLHNDGHIAGTGTDAEITVGLLDDNAAFNASTNPGIGAFVYRSSAGSGTFTSTGLKLRWDYGADGITGGTNVQVKVFAIEMVQVLEGAFNYGGGGGSLAYTSTTISTRDATVTPSGTGSLGGEAGGYPSGQTAPDNASWPNGYNAFYCMKYEVTQQQYVDFLNTLTQTQATARKSSGSNNRYAITGSAVGSYATTNPNVSCNFQRWTDGAALADWSGLRPMTELEFEKACRGPQLPVMGEKAWGTADVASSAYTLSGAGTASEGVATNYSTTVGNAIYNATLGTINGPSRVGIFANETSGRVSAGASYWGIMELSGNLWEYPVTIGNATGRAFTGTHGDGLLTSSGDADAATWPGANTQGTGYRGGSWYYDANHMRVSDRTYANYANAGGFEDVGFRAVRRSLEGDNRGESLGASGTKMDEVSIPAYVGGLGRGDILGTSATLTTPTLEISGKISWRTDPTVGIINTAVAVSGDGTGTVTTLADGLYSFALTGSNFEVTPTKTTGKLNGVTALDVARVSQHVGSTLPFTNPLDFIAADINKSNTLTTTDATTLQNALLNNPIALNLFKSSWRFVPTGTMFSTPYGSTAFWNFAEKRTYTGITTDQINQDFSAIKVGDLVTPSVNPALKPAPAVPVVFAVPDVSLTAGATVEVPFRCEHFEDLVALQACFWFNPSVLALDAVLPSANMPIQAGNFGTWELAEGRLRLVWAVATAETKVGNPELFKLRFRVLQGGYSLGDVLSISQKDMVASAWHTDYRPERVTLAYTPVTEAQQREETSTEGVGFELYQNEPNPFEDKTVIRFQLPAAAAATLTVYDAAGRVLFTQQGDYAKGYNAMVLDRSLLKTAGVMYYTLETATASATKKMIQIK